MKRICLAVMLACAAGGVHALTLSEAVEKTVLRSPDVRSSWYSFRSGSEAQRVAEGGYYPRVNLQAGAGQVWPDEPGSSDRYDNSSAALELRQTLFDGFATRESVRRAGFEKQARYYALLATSDEYALESVRAYLDVQRYTERVELARQSLETHERVFKLIEERTLAGVGRRVDLEQASGRRALAESNLMTEEANLHDVGERFLRLVGELPVDLQPAPALSGELPPRTEVLELAVRNNPAFLSSVAMVRAARADTGTAGSTFYPTLELMARSGIEQNRDGVDGEYKDNRVMLLLNYNLLNGGSDRARVRQSGEQLNAAFEQRDKACRDLRQTASIAWNDIDRLDRQLRYLEQHELSTRKARDAYAQQFEIGQRTLLDVLDTENELFDAALSLTSARYDREIAVARVLANTHQLLSTLKLAPLEAQIDPNEFGGSDVSDEQTRCSLAMNEPAQARTVAPKVAAAEVVKPEPVAFDEAGLRSAVAQWAAAWAAKDVDRYLSFYAQEFVPENGRDRAVWEDGRRRAVSKPGDIKVTLGDITTRQTGADAAESEFIQQYASNNYRDTVVKTLDWKRVDGGWRIVRERAVAQK
ncbi:TolC family outer membrane protein [Chitinibacteraceae bacterium HSL-7]